MSVASRLSSLERKHGGPHSECRCNGGKPELLYCRDPSVPAPPPRRCARCARAVPRVIFGMGPLAPGEVVEREPAYQHFDNLREFYEGTVRSVPAYEYVPPGALRAQVRGEATGGAP